MSLPFDPFKTPEDNPYEDVRLDPAGKAVEGGSQTSPLAILSLVFGAVSPVLMCACFASVLTAPAAIILGHMARRRIRESPGLLKGSGMALAGLTLGYITLAATAGLIAINIFMWRKPGVMPSPIESTPGQMALQDVERKIVTDAEGTALGNTPQAQEMAKAFGTSMEAVSKVIFALSDKKVKSSGRPYVTWCELRPGRCAFVAHVPDYRRFGDDAKKLLARMAWQSAQQGVKGTLKEGDQLAVGLKGDLLYGAVMLGKVTAAKTNIREIGVDKSRLYPFFANEAPGKLPSVGTEGAATAEPSRPDNPAPEAAPTRSPRGVEGNGTVDRSPETPGEPSIAAPPSSKSEAKKIRPDPP
jgi:hypothetical protein